MTGQILRDFELISSEGQRVRASDYRGRRNLVLVLAGDFGNDPCHRFLSDLARHYPLFLQKQAEVLAVVRASMREAKQIKLRGNLAFQVLADEDGQVHSAFGATDPSGDFAATIYITDRYGEIYLTCQTGERHSLPTIEEMLEWLDFINIQCPECGVAEWPL